MTKFDPMLAQDKEQEVKVQFPRPFTGKNTRVIKATVIFKGYVKHEIKQEIIDDAR